MFAPQGQIRWLFAMDSALSFVALVLPIATAIQMTDARLQFLPIQVIAVVVVKFVLRQVLPWVVVMAFVSLLNARQVMLIVIVYLQMVVK